jgi:pimeloyl-ACP methyl ester carboxylesterase
MICALETRELILLDGLNVIVPATYHKVCEEDSTQQSKSIEGRVGVLFLNSLSPTRAAAGDSAVYWADSFARSGYPCFRVDLPGFGDSLSDPASGLLEFINGGGYASIASAKANEIVERFNLSGVIVVGLCAGAVTAIYTAAATMRCKGLVLMDPYFHLPLKESSKMWQKVTGRLSRSALGLGIGNLSYQLRCSWRVLTGNAPPGNANFPLLNCWKGIATTGLPMILFRAPGFKLRGEFDYLTHILKLAGRTSNIVVKVVDDANHTFSNRAGRVAVRQNIESWLASYFPLAGGEEIVEGVLPSKARGAQGLHSTQRAAAPDAGRMHAIGCALEGG